MIFMPGIKRCSKCGVKKKETREEIRQLDVREESETQCVDDRLREEPWSELERPAHLEEVT